MSSIEIQVGKVLAVLGIGTVIVAQALPVEAVWKTFANAVGVAFTAMSVYLMHDTNGKNSNDTTQGQPQP